MMRKTLMVALVLSLISVGTVAQINEEEKDQDLVGSRLGPENFSLGAPEGTICYLFPEDIPDADPAGLTTTLVVNNDCGPIGDLNLSVWISHTWVGDLQVTLTKVDGPSALLIDRPGFDGSGFGCSGDDIQATLNDEARSAVEDECAASVPTIQGEFIPGDPPSSLLTSFDGFDTVDVCGTWELTVVDAASGDLGTQLSWCLVVGPFIGEDAVPASDGLGNVLLVSLLVGAGAYFIRRRVTG